MSTDPHTPAGLIAILRGLSPQEAPAIGAALHEAGIHRLEVPLNSPDPFASIELLSQQLGEDCRVGAGTVVTVADVDRVHEAGGQMVVAPNTDPAVITRAVELGMERSEEHTSELQSRGHLVCGLLLAKKQHR